MVAKTPTKKAAKAVDAAASKAEAKAAALAAYLKSQDKKTEDEGGPSLRLNDNRARVNIKTISTGAISVDVAINGGIPIGRITEIYGPEGGGKTTLALTAAKNCQDAGGVIGFVDMEQGLNRELCKNIGIDEDRFIVAQPRSGEQAITKVEEMIKSEAFDMIIIDSIAGMISEAELEADADKAFMGAHARLIAKLMKRTAGIVNTYGVALLCINQVRVSLADYGAPEKSTGGKALKYWASLRLEVKSNITSKKIERNKQIIGQTVTVVVRKNRLGAPGKSGEYDVIFGHGIEGSGAILSVAEDLGIVTRAGASYTEVATGERIGIGKDTVKALIKEDTELSERLTAAIYAQLSNGGEAVEAPEDPEERQEMEEELVEYGIDED